MDFEREENNEGQKDDWQLDPLGRGWAKKRTNESLTATDLLINPVKDI